MEARPAARPARRRRPARPAALHASRGRAWERSRAARPTSLVACLQKVCTPPQQPLSSASPAARVLTSVRRSSKFSNDRRKAICCVSLRCDCESKAKSRVAWRGEITLLKTTFIYLL
eukprot:2438629-Pleurochrysis_carterae.AAC.3